MAKKKIRVGVIFGGRSAEHEVSLVSAASIVSALDRKKYDVVPIGISARGRWLSAPDAIQLLKAGGEHAEIPEKILLPDPTKKDLIALGTGGGREGNEPIDVIFPVVHGTFGEDGTLQGLLELANLPYVGAGVLGSAAGMDKDIMKALFRSADLPIVKHVTILRSDWDTDHKKAEKIVDRALKYPV